MNIKTKEASSLLVAVLAAAIVALATALAHVAWWVVLCVAVGTFLIVALFALFVIRKYVAYKLKPIYSIVFSRNVHTHEILDELSTWRASPKSCRHGPRPATWRSPA